MNRTVKWKINAIIILAVAILLGLLVLLFTTPKSKDVDVEPTPTAEVVVTPTPTPEEPEVVEPTATPEITVDLYSEDSINVLVNKSHLLSSDYKPADLVDVKVHSAETHQMRREAAEALEAMFNQAIAEKIYLKLVSGYRSYWYQKDLYNYYISIRGLSFADTVDAYPGASEHQTGLAADIGLWNGACELEYCFTNYRNYAWLQEHAHEYGFIERYPEGKQDVTRIRYSPWHFRYVGVEEATKIHESGLTMEEYYGLSAY